VKRHRVVVISVAASLALIGCAAQLVERADLRSDYSAPKPTPVSLKVLDERPIKGLEATGAGPIQHRIELSPSLADLTEAAISEKLALVPGLKQSQMRVKITEARYAFANAYVKASATLTLRLDVEFTDTTGGRHYGSYVAGDAKNDIPIGVAGLDNPATSKKFLTKALKDASSRIADDVKRWNG